MIVRRTLMGKGQLAPLAGRGPGRGADPRCGAHRGATGPGARRPPGEPPQGAGSAIVISAGFADRNVDDRPDCRLFERFREADKFLELAKLAAERGKPIVLIKIGRSELGARAARSHTAALTGADAGYDAIFAQYGVIRVQDYDELWSGTLRPGPEARARHRGGIPLGRHQLAHRRHVRSGRSRSAVAWAGGACDIDGILEGEGFGWAANPARCDRFCQRSVLPANHGAYDR